MPSPTPWRRGGHGTWAFPRPRPSHFSTAWWKYPKPHGVPRGGDCRTPLPSWSTTPGIGGIRAARRSSGPARKSVTARFRRSWTDCGMRRRPERHRDRRWHDAVKVAQSGACSSVASRSARCDHHLADTMPRSVDTYRLLDDPLLVVTRRTEPANGPSPCGNWPPQPRRATTDPGLWTSRSDSPSPEPASPPRSSPDGHRMLFSATRHTDTANPATTPSSPRCAQLPVTVTPRTSRRPGTPRRAAGGSGVRTA